MALLVVCDGNIAGVYMRELSRLTLAAQVATGVLYIFTILCYAGLVVEIVLKATLQVRLVAADISTLASLFIHLS